MLSVVRGSFARGTTSTQSASVSYTHTALGRRVFRSRSASGKGRTEYIGLPAQAEAAPLSTGPQSQGLAGAIPIGFIRNNRVYAIHTDHLGTPRLVTDDDGKPIWQWPYSAFGDHGPTGVLRVTTNAATAITNQPVQLRATAPQEFNLRFPGQYFDSETKLAYNYFRNYQAATGRYTQADPIGLDGGLNRWAYVDGQSLGDADPEGLKPRGRNPAPIPGDLGRYPHIPDPWRKDHYRDYRDGYFKSVCVERSCPQDEPEACTPTNPNGNRTSWRNGPFLSNSANRSMAGCTCKRYEMQWFPGWDTPNKVRNLLGG